MKVCGYRSPGGHLWVLILGLGLLSVFPVDAQEPFVTPQKYPIKFYSSLLEKSPFAQATLLQANASQDGFSKDLALVSHYRLNGVLYVNLLDRKTQKHVVATSGGDPSSGIKVISLTRSDSPWGVKAVIELNGERGEVGFDLPPFAQNAGSKVASAVSRSDNTVQRTTVRSSHRDGD